MDSPIKSPIFMPKSPVAIDEHLGEVKKLPPLFEIKLRPFFERIIDKKVHQVALTILEAFIDKLCAYFYAAYRHRLSARLAEFNKEQEDDQAISPMQKMAEKIVYFTDGAPLFDRTANHRVKIQPRQVFNLLTGQTQNAEDMIIVDNKRVCFSKKGTIYFGKQYDTKEAFATDIKECPELVFLYERETSGNLNAWCIDTTQPVKEKILGGQLVIAEDDVFIAKQLAPNQPSSPILKSFI